MIEPYETALRNASPALSKLGFSLVRNSEYGATFSDGSYSIELSTDRYYHPELCGTIRDPSGKQFEIGLVRQILDPAQSAEATTALKAVRQRFGLDERGTSSEMRSQGIAEYVRVALDQLLRFVAAHRKRVFASPNEYEADYLVRSNALLSKMINVSETNGWKAAGTVIEGKPLVIGGLNVWNHVWKRLPGPALQLPHLSYPLQLHTMTVYEITDRGECVRFAAGEVSANVWAFYLHD
jgi:hypothetical protein